MNSGRSPHPDPLFVTFHFQKLWFVETKNRNINSSYFSDCFDSVEFGVWTKEEKKRIKPENSQQRMKQTNRVMSLLKLKVLMGTGREHRPQFPDSIRKNSDLVSSVPRIIIKKWF